jgi:hypothetical protein
MLPPDDGAGVFVGTKKAVNRAWKSESTYTADSQLVFSKCCDPSGPHAALFVGSQVSRISIYA